MKDETLFVSDCHLDPARPEVIEVFCSFIEQRACKARCLYILGDLFEVWLGDDDDLSGLHPVIRSLQHLSRNTRICFMAGNRDFLLGSDFAESCGIELLAEPEKIRLGRAAVLLIHGDTLCTDDQDYQSFRALVRAPEWQAQFLEKPLVERQQIARQLRRDSVAAMTQKSNEIMDVNEDTVALTFLDHSVETIIHGHTHRPAVHHYPDNYTRYVLGDWHDQPSFLSWTEEKAFQLNDPRVA